MMRKLSRKFQARERLIRNQLSSLILFEQIETSQAKGKILKSEAEGFISSLKKEKEDFNLIREINKVLYGGAQKKAFDYRNKFKSVRIIKNRNRLGDNSPQVIVKLEIEEKTEKASKKPEIKK